MSKRELRAPRKKYFKLEYPTVMNVLESLTEPEMGEYFKSICTYELYGEEPEGFSDRAVQMAFRMTARELDFQLEKHFNRQEQGRINRQGGESDNKGTELREQLSNADYDFLRAKYERVDELIAEVQFQVDENCTTVRNPLKYIDSYAEQIGWDVMVSAIIEQPF